MAISTINPAAEDHGDLIPDPITLTDAIRLFSQAGVSISKTTLSRMIADDGIPVAGGGIGRAIRVSYSDLLEAEARRHEQAAAKARPQAIP